MLWTADAEGTTFGIGDRWLSYMGDTVQPMTEADWTALIHPEDRVRVVELWKESAKRKSAFEVEIRLRLRGESYRWFSVHAVPVLDEDGAFVEWIGASTDIHPRKVAEAALRESEQRYRTIVDTAQEGVWLIDKYARTTFANARLAEMLGYSWE
jgi:PAS domain S-box-containing protein